jgi:hypothetical protein
MEHLELLDPQNGHLRVLTLVFGRLVQVENTEDIRRHDMTRDRFTHGIEF